MIVKFELAAIVRRAVQRRVRNFIIGDSGGQENRVNKNLAYGSHSNIFIDDLVLIFVLLAVSNTL